MSNETKDKKVNIEQAEIANCEARTRLLNAQAHELELKNKKTQSDKTK